MSRLIIKNLPKIVTKDEVKEFFSEKGIITDVQLKYTEDGKFRRFGFIGYKTEEEAADALKYFNNCYLKNSKLVVEYCAAIGDASKPQSWSKYAPDSKVNQIKKSEEEAKSKKKANNDSEDVKKEKKKEKKDKDDKIKEMLKKHKDDPLFSEFLESHTKGDKQAWSNDKLLGLNLDDDSDKEINKDEEVECDDNAEEEKDKIAKKAISDKEYFQALKSKSQGTKDVEVKESKSKGSVQFFTVKVNGLGYNHKKKDIKQLFHGVKPKSIRVPQKIKGIAYVGFKTEKQMKQALAKDKTFYDGKRIFVTKYVKKEQIDNKDENGNKKLRWKQQEDTVKNSESIAESGRIFLRNLCYTTTEDDIRAIFEKYGPLTEVNIPIDFVTRKSKGFGTVTFLMPEHAAKAFEELDGSVQSGRYLHLLPGKPMESLDDKLDDESLNFKEKKELKLKKSAGNAYNWNSLFLDQNAVANSIAKKYNITKEQLFEDNKKTSIAVLLAQGETELVLETQKFLEENGVHLNAFNEPPKKRSKTIILIKNLPSGTTAQEIREMFAKFGVLGRVVLPPTGITALVEFIEPSEARKAFTKLAYTKFKSLPLYLEWAPDESFKSPASVTKPAESSKTAQTAAKENLIKETTNEPSKNDKTEAEESDEDDEPEPDTTLYVKNLHFNTTEEQLKKHFEKCGRLDHVHIQRKLDTKNPGNKLSMGYGFVRYKLKADLEKALKELQSSSLDGKTLELKRSERVLQSDVKTARKTNKVKEQTGTKILVRNIPFQANADEIKDLFKAFGEIKSVRLPKKMVGDEKHRGFGFVEFYTKKDAKKAFQSLCLSTHLYGRRLNLEWAQAEENIEDLRKRTAKHYHEEPLHKKSKKGTLDPESIGLEKADAFV